MLLWQTIVSLLPGAAVLTPAEPARATVTLQVNLDSGYNSTQVVQLLSDGVYLNSVFPGLIASDTASPPDGTCAVTPRSPLPEVVTIELLGNEPARLRQATEALLKNLAAFEPAVVAQAKQALQMATERMADADRAAAEATSLLLKLRAEHSLAGLSEPENALATKRAELEDLQFNLSDDQSLRDYLAAGLKNEPEVVPAASEAVIRGLIDEAKQLGDYVQQLERSGKKDDAALALQRMHDVEERLATMQRKEANPRWRELEQQLFETERRLALNARRVALLRDVVGRLTEGARIAAELQARTEELSGNHDQAITRKREASESLERARDDSRRLTSAPWIRVIAGPQYSASASPH